MHTLPEYTLSLLIWIIPLCAMLLFIIIKRLLTPEKLYALCITVVALAVVGCTLDLLFAQHFFTFPDKNMVLGITIRGIPVEEFVFYITGFWFILLLYVFCDEYFLVRYNVPDQRYARYRSRLKKLLFLNYRGILWALVLVVTGTVLKHGINPAGSLVPGYFIFLVIVAYVPMILFYRVTRKYINWPGFVVTLLITLLISIIWEVTLALPRGYWNYQHGSMLGLFIGVWNQLPIEAVTVWVFCTLIILFYEFLKICYFTPLKPVPCYALLLSVGKRSVHVNHLP